MKTEKIIADSMPLALKKVRQQLGENAIIVNTRAITTGGVFGFFSKQKYEVTAYAIEKGSSQEQPKFILERKEELEKKNQESLTEELKNNSVFHKKPQKLYDYYSQPSSMSDKPSSPSAKSKENEDQLLEELQHMRKMMMKFMLDNKKEQELPSGLVKWVNRLKKQCVEEEVVEHILTTFFKKHDPMADLDDEVIKNEILSIITEILEMRIPESNTINEQTRVINMIGPTGVGKTTSIAKLATEQVLKQKRRVAMITTDVYRIAAVEQLKTYAGILNVPIEVVRSADDLTMTLNKLAQYDLIYMDTTGRNYNEVKNRATIFELLNHPVSSDNYLVLSLTTKYEDMQLLLDGFLDSPIQKLILTKFDETFTYGSILNIAYKYPYQLSYITNGQSVPEDITTIDAGGLARSLLGVEI